MLSLYSLRYFTTVDKPVPNMLLQPHGKESIVNQVVTSSLGAGYSMWVVVTGFGVALCTGLTGVDFPP